MEAFEERGEGNFLYSTDFEDVICLFNGRETIADEIGCDAPLAKLLGSKFGSTANCRHIVSERRGDPA